MTTIVDELASFSRRDSLQLAIRGIDNSNTADPPREEIAAKVSRIDIIRLEYSLVKIFKGAGHRNFITIHLENSFSVLLGDLSQLCLKIVVVFLPFGEQTSKITLSHL